ncbi:hypothetical protein [Nakamurella leprariae]|uniref:Uncharacterized protein n=1 Tax=Nakamurella leprariae TaxID=2803911 RepID=A0A938YI27_9ACTN|nr:hypothetical protein [Nakamurella leprariae]MBM9468727.1 hypothetical protein [Nakamurella leprariae]
MRHPTIARPSARFADVRAAASIILLVLAGGGWYGGVALLTDPSGAALGLRRDMLPDWFLADYRWAGLVLLLAFGVGALVAAGLVLGRRRTGWPAVIALGAVLLLWMAMQLAMIGLILPPMQLTFVVVGVALLLLGLRGTGRAVAPTSRQV